MHPNGSRAVGGESKQRFSALPVQRILFWLVAFATLVNANHFLNLTTGTGWPATLGLTACCIFLGLAVRLPLRHVLGVPGSFFVAALVSYIFIGLSVALVVGAPIDPDYSSLPFRGGFAILVMVATALGASATLLWIGAGPLLKGILAILTVTCILVLATPLLLDHVYTSLPERWGSIAYESRARFSGTFTRPTTASTVTCYAAALALSFLSYGRYRIFATMALSLACAATILTTSRAGILTLGIVFLAFLIPLLQSRRKFISLFRWIGALFVAGGIVLTAVALGPLRIQEQLSSRLGWFLDFKALTPAGVPMNSRLLEIWPLGLSKAVESPLFGNGIAQFHRLKDAPFCQLELRCGSHNSYLMFWGEAGILPLLFLVLGIGSLWWTCWRLPRSVATSTATGWTLIFSLACMVRDGEPYFVWSSFIIGLSCALVSHAARESRRRQRGSSKTQRTSPQTKFDSATPSVMG